MNTKTKTRTEQILMVMHIVAWVAFVGFMIEGGAILVSFVVGIFNSQGTKFLYKDLSLDGLRDYHTGYYLLTVGFMLALSGMKAWVSYLVIKMLSKFNLANPFTAGVAASLEKISMAAFTTWVLTMLSNAFTVGIHEITGKLHGSYISGDFIIMVGLVFIIAQVFKRGVELQSENDLTV